MNFKLTASILVIMLGLLAVVIYLRHEGPVKTQHIHGRVFPLSSSPVVGLTFTTQGKPVLKMTKKGGHWYIIAPRKAWGRDFAISELCSQIAELKYHFRVPLASSGKYSAVKLGLKPARDSLTLTRADGKTLHLAIGRSTLGGRLYVAADRKYAFVVSRHFLRSLLKGEKNFATKSLTRFHAAAVESITIQRGHTRFRIVRRGKRWIIRSPLLARANPTKVTNWLSNLQLLAAHRFPAKNEPAIKHVAFRVKVTFRKLPSSGMPKKTPAKIPPPLVVTFGSYTDLTHQYIHALSSANPNLAIIRATSFSQLERSLSHFQDRALTRAKLTKASRIILTRAVSSMPFAPPSMYLIRNGAKWKLGTAPKQFAGGPLLSAEKSAVADWLGKLSAIRAKSCVNSPTPQLAQFHPIGTITFDLPDRVHPLKLTFGPANKGGLTPVKVSGWNTIYMVSTVRIKPLFPTAAGLRSRVAAKVPASGIDRISLTDQTHHAELVKGKKGWLMEPGAKKVSSVDIASLTAELDPIRAHKWLTHMPMPRHPVDVKIDFQPATEGKTKSAKTLNPAETSGILRIWSETLHAAAKSKKPAKAVKKYFAQWLPGGKAASRWVFVPGGNLLSGVKQLLADAGFVSATR